MEDIRSYIEALADQLIEDVIELVPRITDDEASGLRLEFISRCESFQKDLASYAAKRIAASGERIEKEITSGIL